VKRGEGRFIPIYIILMKLTVQGIKEIKNAPQRIEETMLQFREIGGRSTRLIPSN